MAKRGQKITLNEEMINKLYNAIGSGLPDKYAIALCGVGHSTYYLWLQIARQDKEAKKNTIYTELLDKIEKARAAFILNNVKAIAEAGKTDWHAKAWLLERRDPACFAKPVRPIMNIDDNAPEETEVMAITLTNTEESNEDEE